MSQQPPLSPQSDQPNKRPLKQKGLKIPAPLGAVLSIVPGLGQLVTGHVTRAILLFFFIVSIWGLSAWRIDNEEISVSFPEMAITPAELSAPQENALIYAFLASSFALLGYLWNIYDGFACASGKSSPPRLGMTFLLFGTLIIGAHITEIDVGKAVREVDDVRPRLSQIIWPWDNVLTRDVEQLDGSALWQTPCEDDDPEQPEHGDDEPYITLDPVCGEPSGMRRPDGTRDPGTLVTINGFNFRPEEPAELIVSPESIPEFRVVQDGERVSIVPDENGEFEYEFTMPNFTIPITTVGAVEVDIIVRQEKEVGSPKLVEDFWLALEGIIETIFLALMATSAGLVLAVPMSFLAARNLMASNGLTVAIYYLVRLLLNVVRSIEPLIWALIAIIWVGPGPFAGVMALAIHTIAALGKLYSESIENIDDGPIEAIQATGADRLQTIVYAVVPQIIPPFVSFTIYRWDINVRMSTIIGTVGGGGIGFILIQWIRLADYDAVGIAVWMIAIVVSILDYASARIREMYV